MTKEELAKVPFKHCGRISFSFEHQSTYYNEQYGFKMVAITPCRDVGMTFGRTKKHFYYNGEWYKSLNKFLEAIKDVEFKPIEK